MKRYSIMLSALLLSVAVCADEPSSGAGAVAGGIPSQPQRLWRVDMGSAIKSVPLFAGNRIYCLAERGPLAAFSISGEEIWSTRFSTNSTFSAPMVYAPGNIVVGSEQGELIAVDADNGSVRWRYKLGDNIQGSPNWTEEDGRKLILAIGQSSGSIHCLEMATGNLVWKINKTNRCDGSPAIRGSKLVFGNCDAALYFYSVADGNLQGKVDLGPEGQVAGGVALIDDLAFTGTYGGSLVCVDTKKKEIVWRFEETDGSIYTTPAIDSRHVVFTTDRGMVYCLDIADGKAEWKKEVVGSPQSPVIADGKVIVSSSGKLHIFSLEDGESLWSYPVGDETTSPALADGKIVVGSVDGNLWLFGESGVQED